MALRVLVVGGYGNFGSIVCRHLVDMPGIELAISGRDPQKLERKVAELGRAASAGVVTQWAPGSPLLCVR